MHKAITLPLAAHVHTGENAPQEHQIKSGGYQTLVLKPQHVNSKLLFIGNYLTVMTNAGSYTQLWELGSECTLHLAST